MSDHGTSIVIEELRTKPNLLLCAATGSSPLGLYEGLTRLAKMGKGRFKDLRVLKLDEWIGLGKSAEGSCEHYLRANVIEPLEISEDRYLTFDPDAHEHDEECKRVQYQIQKNGPIDLCVLGLGKNGHLGFNEPGSFLQPNCHVAHLTPESQQHDMVVDGTAKPKYGMTLGIRDILLSKKIIILVSGEEKDEAKRSLFSGQISTTCPASFLWLHNNVDCLVVG